MMPSGYEFEGRVAVVTGGSDGIGAATARLFAEYGASVVITGRTEATLRTTSEAIERDTGGRCLAMVADARDEQQVRDTIARTVKELGRIDILINNVGWASQHVPVCDLEPAGWHKDFSLNLDTAFFYTRAAGAHFCAQKSGAIVNVSSVAGEYGIKGFAAFSSAKAALQMFTRVSAGEWGPHGVRVNCVAPGLIATAKALKEGAEAGIDHDAICAGKPLGRAGTPEEVAHAIVFLASDAASYITGETLSVRGGPNVN